MIDENLDLRRQLVDQVKLFEQYVIVARRQNEIDLYQQYNYVQHNILEEAEESEDG